MNKPKLNTYREVVPLVYSWSTPDVPKYDGWEKIGYTEREDPRVRLREQASQMSIEKNFNWVRRAAYLSVEGGVFTDKEFHAYLKQCGVERELKPERTEWHRFSDQPKSSLSFFTDFAGSDFSSLQTGSTEDYRLRAEQEEAVTQAFDAFANGGDKFLWNAKPRFGKTLATYDLMRRLDAEKVLVVTNRPAIANSWFDDFVKFIGHQTTFKFVSDSPSLSERNPMTRQQWARYATANAGGDHRIVEFVSLQDLKGSHFFGGQYDKLKSIADLDWDLLVIDESHEGVDTAKTDIALDQVRRQHTLYLSGTPFKQLASGFFTADQIFNWTYVQEQEAKANWEDGDAESPYDPLPSLNMFTYQMSRMISDHLAQGVAIEEDSENIDYAFNLNEFFSVKDNGYFEHEEHVIKWLDTLTSNEKYPFSTPQLRDEIRHSFWLLDRVAAAKALERLLRKHEAFQDYTVVLVAGDGRSDDSDPVAAGKALDRVRTAIAEAEATGGKTITLSVGQLTTGVTVPEWTAVMMLSNLNSPAQYMQAAFRAQNPAYFERDGKLYRKENAYIFDFAPERTLTIYDAFANNLRSNPSGSQTVRQDNIRHLLNFFPIIGEDSEGRMVALDATQVLTFPQVFKAREVVRRGFLSNLLFDNVAGIFRYSEHFRHILDKLPEAKQAKTTTSTITMPEPLPVTDQDGNVQVDHDLVINPKVAELGKPVWGVDQVPKVEPNTTATQAATQMARFVTAQTAAKREALAKEYGLSKAQSERDIKRTEAIVKDQVKRAVVEQEIASKHLAHEMKAAATEAEAAVVEERLEKSTEEFQQHLGDIVASIAEQIVPEVVTREETKVAQKQADKTMDEARAHLRGFARTIPMFLMAYGDRDTRLSNLDDYTPDDVFEEVTGITEEEFRLLRDGQTVTNDDGTQVEIPGLFDEAVFDQSIQEFLDKKSALTNYFDEDQRENIFAYIPQQKTSLVFTPQPVVKMMVDLLEAENPGIFNDPTKTFADLFSTAGLFLMELVRRLDAGLADQIPDQEERLHHILTKQIFEMSHNKILHKITIEAVSGGVPQRREWIDDSGHFQVGNLARMTPQERQKMVDDMLTEGN